MFYKNSLILLNTPLFTHDGYGNLIINLFLLINNLKFNLLVLEVLYIFKHIYVYIKFNLVFIIIYSAN